MRWLTIDGNPDEWYVAYHGVRVSNKAKDMANAVSNIVIDGLMVGRYHKYDKKACMRNPG